MAKKKRAVADRVVAFANVLEGRQLITATVGPDLEPVLLSLGRDPDYRFEQNHASFPKQRADAPNDYRVHFRAGDEWCHLDLPPTPENYHFVQPFPRGRWLLVRGRASGDADRNARVYEPDGTPGPAFHAGDGIADVQATERGRAWVSYFDEGVFGDDPLSQSGLVCFDQDGTPAFRLDALPDPVLKTMADCYALNACSDAEVWLCFYTDFPLVRLVDGRVAGHWAVPVKGSPGFAVGRGRVLMAGGYDRRGSLFLGTPGSPRFDGLAPVDTSGQAIGRFAAFGRRDRLFLTTDEALYAVDLDAV